MKTGIWILGNQLSIQHAALQDSQQDAPIILIESLDHIQERRYHRQKIVLVWSAMRHFAEELRQSGWTVSYFERAENFFDPLKQWIQEQEITDLKVMRPSDRPFVPYLEELELPCELHWLPNNQFLWSEAAFQEWAEGRKRLLMEDFYREGRKRFDILMAGDEPVGDQWNFDKQNRKPPTQKLETPAAPEFEPDEITQQVIQQVQDLKVPLYGQVEPFRWAVTREQALEVLTDFVEVRLETFGPYQDAMVTGEDTLWHALLSPYLNLGLLHPLEVIQAVETAYEEDDLPINSIEGFIRQVLGWREYMRGLYSFMAEDYAEKNWFGHTHPLPDFFWDSEKTQMNCLRQVLNQVERSSYAHHIQRLMIVANFSLIAGLSPQAVKDWFHAAFIDAYDWVMQTNVIGMGLFADGGTLASKPYAASANYVNKMSDYCKSCSYKHKERTGDQACPFNVFYWDFLARHREQLYDLGRMGLVLSHLKKMSDSELEEIHQRAEELRGQF
ncbi:MAG: cryptochrome/photolyase family protein [Microcoleaceae cyanobacterium]